MKQTNAEAGRGRIGFTLIELVIVMVVISILMAIAVPIYLRQRIAANESSAIGSLRTIITSEEAFRSQRVRDDDNSGDGDYGTLLELSAPPAGQPFIDAVLGNGFKSGYLFHVEVFPGTDTDEAAFSVVAFPQVYNRTGIRNFYADQEGVIRFTVGQAGQGNLNANSPPVH